MFRISDTSLPCFSRPSQVASCTQGHVGRTLVGFKFLKDNLIDLVFSSVEFFDNFLALLSIVA